MKTLGCCALVLLGCEGTIQGRRPAPEAIPLEAPETPTTHVEGPQYATARCEGAGQTRTFSGLDGAVLEALRVDAAVTLDRRRTRTFESFDEWGADLNGKLGWYLASQNFDSQADLTYRAEYWWNEPQMGALELYSQFRVTYLVCNDMLSKPAQSQGSFNASPDFQSAPTAESAARRCKSMMRRFWKVEPEAAQIAACADYAVNDTADAESVGVRWALVCAALLSSTGATTM